ncbi:hypothetical protein ACU4GD_35020 [Cupriavidus basilensis]
MSWADCGAHRRCRGGQVLRYMYRGISGPTTKPFSLFALQALSVEISITQPWVCGMP